MSMSQQDFIRKAGDGTACHSETVNQGYRTLQIRSSVYEEPPTGGTGLRLGIYQAQADYGPGASEKNRRRMVEVVEKARGFEIQLLAFPELFVTGYTLSHEDVKNVAETKDGESVSMARTLAEKHNLGIILPYAEMAEVDGVVRYYDSIAVIDEKGELLDSYRKTHLYGQQERDDFSVGDSDFPVHRIWDFPVGVLNCYECEFFELVRILALNGAKLIVGPTAADTFYTLPDGRRSSVPFPDVSENLLPAYAYANNLFYAYANRCGYEERGGEVWHYRGNSIVCGPHGDTVVKADSEQDTLLVADCVPAYYGATHPAPDYHYLKDRRPELYGKLTAQTAEFHDQSKNPLDLNTRLSSSQFRY